MGAKYFDTSDRTVQYGDTITVTLTYNTYVKGFRIFQTPITLTAKHSGLSMKYHRRHGLRRWLRQRQCKYWDLRHPRLWNNQCKRYRNHRPQIQRHFGWSGVYLEGAGIRHMLYRQGTSVVISYKIKNESDLMFLPTSAVSVYFTAYNGSTPIYSGVKCALQETRIRCVRLQL